MTTATMIALLHKADPSGAMLVVLDGRENDEFHECGAVRTRQLSLDEDGVYASPWDVKSKLAAESHIALLT